MGAATLFGKVHRSQAPSVASLNVNGPPSFFVANLALLRSLLSVEGLTFEQKEGLYLESQKLLAAYTPIIQHVAQSFPTNGDIWLEIVMTLASTCGVAKEKGVRLGSTTLSPEDVDINNIIPYVAILTANLVEYPFPERWLPSLPPILQVEEATRVWWDVLKQGLDATSSKTIAGPPTGVSCGGTFGSTGNLGQWTEQKYGAAVSAAHVVDVSLTFLIEKSVR